MDPEIGPSGLRSHSPPIRPYLPPFPSRRIFSALVHP